MCHWTGYHLYCSLRSSKTGRVEREGRKVKEVNVIVLDSDPEETSGSSQSYNMEEANDTKLRNSMVLELYS